MGKPFPCRKGRDLGNPISRRCCALEIVADKGDGQQSSAQRVLVEGPDVLVVTFASAPGVPNWGGVLGRLSREATPEEKQFDILFVCDGGRDWYSGACIILPLLLSATWK